MLKVLDLFSGIGGFSLGLERTGMFETVAFCEIEPFCQEVLKKHWPDVPIFEDVRKLKGEDIGTVDVICGGYPCQPFSTAGKRAGAEDDRHLWPEVLRLITECRPDWFIGENVAGHISLGLDQVLFDLENTGYSARAFVIPAVAKNARHRRDRVWIIANAMQGVGSVGRDRPGVRRIAKQTARDEIREIEMEACFCGSIDGIPRGMDRLRALGNAVVPQIPEQIGYAIGFAGNEI